MSEEQTDELSEDELYEYSLPPFARIKTRMPGEINRTERDIEGVRGIVTHITTIETKLNTKVFLYFRPSRFSKRESCYAFEVPR